jgi:cysteine desulfurase
VESLPVAYLDNAATTRVDDRVAGAMVQAMTVDFGNPSSAHRVGIAASKRLEAARAQLGRAIGAEARDLYFTSGGTEANALGTLGVAQATAKGLRHAVYSALEHPSVQDAMRRLGERGSELACVAPDRGGVVSVELLEAALREETQLVALMMVSNELGTVQPIAELARAVRRRAPRAHLHVDAVQALGKLPIDVGALGADSIAFSAHKIHGPKGAGALWLRRGARLASLTVGGGQERGVRPGTEGVPGAVGLGLAAELAEAARSEATARMRTFRERTIARAREAFPRVALHGAPEAAAPHIVSLGFPGVPAEPLLHALESRDVYVSAGSACASKDKKPSPSLRAIGVADDVGTLRVSFARTSTEEEVDRFGAALAAALRELGA